ncbi:GntR family transcriptional regulator [Tardiphaga sp.]|jgi:DNA-binding GntR family transcriptional regulator|uniref:GntR family transcriptional regulator n=1 Tax=Tardiphaga sp. TaxID=1926292 RepID=UPI0037D9CC9B
MSHADASQTVQDQSLGARAYEAIKHRIFTVAYAPGAYLNEVSISEELEIGRTPVHHALHRLAKEGLVNVIPRKGVIVRPVSLDEVAQIIEVRLVNEAYCASMAARRVTRADLEAPKAILAEAQREIDSGNGVEGLMNLDQSFHRWIAKVSGNPVLADILANLQDRAARFWFLSLSEAHHQQQVQQEHMDLLQAIAARDETSAASMARAHIESFRNTILRVL